MIGTAFVQGVGTSSFGRQPGVGAPLLAQQAVGEALADAGVDDVRDIDAVFAGTVFGAPGTAQRMLQLLGVTGVPVLTFENACATSTTALHEARQSVLSGRFERVLCLGVETMTLHFAGPITPEHTDAEGRAGLALPGVYAMVASRYEHLYGLEPKALAAVAVKNRRHGALNPRAQHGAEVTAEQVLASRMVADPLTLLQCCDISDAATAAVIGRGRGVDRDVPIAASALRSGELWDHRSTHPWGYELMARVAGEAWHEAGIGPGDVDLFEVHDAFTIGEITATEALGIAEPGGGGDLVLSGHTALGGRQPVNPSGGLLSRGHPLGATGLAQIAEAVWQLRGEAGQRQVEGARIAAVETMGGGTAGIDGNGCVVVVLGG
ncbi:MULTISPECIES: thiolase family protein [Prauserella salsuginis group]|uniref:propanoyl-CoA C-acyltransferase n=2 Tax=Prauserella salsuginis group TaxID=2893672 RepID=A0A839XS19_9PSEU|nr:MULTISPECIES: thiolase family protein [Prauserella salsuginis group]MBB3665537.1 acetyl-CoA C-acetyltransferase [Prauserella sediminis]MCR3718765.1 acetyl-CoA C-acetyltransferase [Prauserella flava]MCR3733335.1 acetyl-CoA C-acetyltransferase [Prauserella salsuginis]